MLHNSLLKCQAVHVQDNGTSCSTHETVLKNVFIHFEVGKAGISILGLVQFELVSRVELNQLISRRKNSTRVNEFCQKLISRRFNQIDNFHCRQLEKIQKCAVN